MILGKHKIFDALTVLAHSGLREIKVSPDFYVGFVREFYRNHDQVWWPPGGLQNAAFHSDDQIVDMADTHEYAFHGIPIRLADE